MGKKKRRQFQYISIEEIKEVLKPQYKRLLEENIENSFVSEEFLFEAFEELYKEAYEEINNVAVISLKKYMAFEVYPYLNSGGVLKHNFNWRTFSEPSLIQEYEKQGMYCFNLCENKICLSDNTEEEIIDENKVIVKTHSIYDFKEHKHLCPKYNIEHKTKYRFSYLACTDCLLKENNKNIGQGLVCDISPFEEE